MTTKPKRKLTDRERANQIWQKDVAYNETNYSFSSWLQGCVAGLRAGRKEKK